MRSCHLRRNSIRTCVGRFPSKEAIGFRRMLKGLLTPPEQGLNPYKPPKANLFDDYRSIRSLRRSLRSKSKSKRQAAADELRDIVKHKKETKIGKAALRVLIEANQGESAGFEESVEVIGKLGIPRDRLFEADIEYKVMKDGEQITKPPAPFTVITALLGAAAGIIYYGINLLRMGDDPILMEFTKYGSLFIFKAVIFVGFLIDVFHKTQNYLERSKVINDITDSFMQSIISKRT